MPSSISSAPAPLPHCFTPAAAALLASANLPASSISFRAAAFFSMLFTALSPHAAFTGPYPTSNNPISTAPLPMPTTVLSNNARPLLYWFFPFSLRLMSSQYRAAADWFSNCSNIPIRMPCAAPVTAPPISIAAPPTPKVSGAAAAAKGDTVAIPIAAPWLARFNARIPCVPSTVSCCIVS